MWLSILHNGLKKSDLFWHQGEVALFKPTGQIPSVFIEVCAFPIIRKPVLKHSTTEKSGSYSQYVQAYRNLHLGFQSLLLSFLSCPWYRACAQFCLSSSSHIIRVARATDGWRCVLYGGERIVGRKDATFPLLGWVIFTLVTLIKQG